MRHLGPRSASDVLATGVLATGVLAFGVLAFAGGLDASAATPLDFLFGGPPLTSRPAYRLRRRPAVPLAQEQPRPQAKIPLPVPRPHFPSDPPTGTAEAGKSVPAAAPPPATEAVKPSQTIKPEAAKPDQSAETTDVAPARPGASPPLPPPKPADLGTPVAPPKSADTQPDAPKPDAPKPAAAKPEPTKPEPTKPRAPAETAKGAAPPAPAAPLPEPPPKQVAKPATPPAVAPSGATTAFTPRSPEDDPQCPSRLAGLKVDVAPTAIGPQPDARCTVVQPVRLAGMSLADGGKIAFPDRPTIACTTADAFSSYVRDLLVPLAKGTFGAPVVAVWTGPGLECRSRDSVFGAKLSAHGQGLAIDIAQLKLADGRLVEVGTPKTDAETAFETAARAGACGYFHTVLGPGSDAYHRTHWHFDLEVRGAKGDSKYCK